MFAFGGIPRRLIEGEESAKQAADGGLIRRAHQLARGVHGKNGNADVRRRHGKQSRGHRADGAAAGQIRTVHERLQRDAVLAAQAAHGGCRLRLGGVAGAELERNARAKQRCAHAVWKKPPVQASR